MNPQEYFLDRIEQAFMLLIREKELLVGSIVIFLGLHIIAALLLKGLFAGLVLDELFYMHSMNYILLLVGGVIWIAFILFYIGITLGFINHLSSVNKGLSPNFLDSMTHGMRQIWATCHTYYYVFLYVYFIPLLCLMVGLLLILLDVFGGRVSLTGGIHSNALLAHAGLWCIGISILVSIYFMIYRGIRASLAIYRAVDYSDFSRDSFNVSLLITNNQARIFGNILGMGLMVGIVSAIISGLLSIFLPAMDTISITTMKELDPASIKHTLDGLSAIGIRSIISSLLGGITTIFSIVFMYILFKRLELESSVVPVKKEEYIGL